MTKDELKALGISDDIIAKLVDDLGKNYVSKSQFNAKNDELKAAKAEHDTMTKELEELKKANKDNESLTAQIDALNKASKEREVKFAAEMAKLRLESAVGMGLEKAKAKNPKAVRALLDDTKLKLNDDGSVAGLSEQIEALQKSDGYLFGGNDAHGIKPGNVNPPAGGNEAGMEAEINKAFGL